MVSGPLAASLGSPAPPPQPPIRARYLRSRQRRSCPSFVSPAGAAEAILPFVDRRSRFVTTIMVSKAALRPEWLLSGEIHCASDNRKLAGLSQSNDRRKPTHCCLSRSQKADVRARVLRL